MAMLTVVKLISFAVVVALAWYSGAISALIAFGWFSLFLVWPVFAVPVFFVLRWIVRRAGIIC